MNLRDYARGQECQIRIPGICCGDNDTVVLCHVRMAGITGMSQKSDDLLGAHGCVTCHDEVDRRTRLLSEDESKLLFLEGIIRTQHLLISRGVVDAKGVRGKR